VKHGEQLAAWCAGTPTAKTIVQPALKQESPTSNTAALKRKLWEMTGAYHVGSKEKLNQWLIDENFIADDQRVEGLTADQLSVTIGKVGDWISQGHGA